MPSKASVKKRVEDELGIELTPEDTRWLNNNTGCVIVSSSGHCSMSQTYGGRNTSSRIGSDSQNLRDATDSDFDTMIPDLKSQGLSDFEIEDARKRLHDLNKDLMEKINERFGTNISY